MAWSGKKREYQPRQHPLIHSSPVINISEITEKPGNFSIRNRIILPVKRLSATDTKIGTNWMKPDIEGNTTKLNDPARRPKISKARASPCEWPWTNSLRRMSVGTARPNAIPEECQPLSMSLLLSGDQRLSSPRNRPRMISRGLILSTLCW